MTTPNSPRNVQGWSAGLPPMTAVPTGAPTADGGMLLILALIPAPGVPGDVLADFVKRFGFVPRTETARAADSRIQWSLQPSGAVSLAFLADDGMSQLELPPNEGVHRWATMARHLGGTVSVMLLPDMESVELSSIALRLSRKEETCWHLSAGFAEF